MLNLRLVLASRAPMGPQARKHQAVSLPARPQVVAARARQPPQLPSLNRLDQWVLHDGIRDGGEADNPERFLAAIIVLFLGIWEGE